MPEGIRTCDAPQCSACGAAGAVLYRDLEDRLFGIPGRWSLLRCDACARVWLSPRPEASEIAKLYAGYHTHEDEAPPGPLQRAVRHGIPAALLGYDAPGLGARLLAQIGPLREAGLRSALGLGADLRGRLLDVGCGAGLLLQTMRDLGWEVSGTEIDAEAAAVARQRLAGAVIHEGRVEDLALDPAHYQAVTLVHVIEHLLDPVATLRACARLLAPGGRIALVTPNAASLGRREFGVHWRGWEPPRHIQVWELASLCRLAEEAGLRVCAASTGSSAAFFLYRESARLRGDAPSTLRALAFWMREYRRVRRGEDCGEELLLIAESATSEAAR